MLALVVFTASRAAAGENMVLGKVISVTDEGILVYCAAGGRFGQYTPKDGTVVFIFDHSANEADSVNLTGLAPAGRYEYTAVSGAAKNVPAYQSEAAVQKLRAQLDDVFAQMVAKYKPLIAAAVKAGEPKLVEELLKQPKEELKKHSAILGAAELRQVASHELVVQMIMRMDAELAREASKRVIRAVTQRGDPAVIVISPVRVNIPRGEVIVPPGARLRLISETPEKFVVDYDGYSVPVPTSFATRYEVSN
jgi:hypothetical protein